MDFCVDASAVYSAPGPGSLRQGGERWGVMVTNPGEGEPDHFDVPIPEGQDIDERYGYLADAIENQLGRTGLAVLVY